MENSSIKYPDYVACPLSDATIDAGLCVVIQDVSGGVLTEEVLPNEFKKKDDWKQICKRCKWYEPGLGEWVGALKEKGVL
ncbi:MAG: hypothetical protein RSB90_07410 [Eubacterium sp.]